VDGKVMRNIDVEPRCQHLQPTTLQLRGGCKRLLEWDYNLQTLKYANREYNNDALAFARAHIPQVYIKLVEQYLPSQFHLSIGHTRDSHQNGPRYRIAVYTTLHGVV